MGGSMKYTFEDGNVKTGSTVKKTNALIYTFNKLMVPSTTDQIAFEGSLDEVGKLPMFDRASHKEKFSRWTPWISCDVRTWLATSTDSKQSIYIQHNAWGKKDPFVERCFMVMNFPDTEEVED